ncbi:MAG TPA: hypothetical protein VGM50_05825 [Gemmatimonadaceae bacterium]
MNTTPDLIVDETSGVATTPEVRNGNVNALLGQATWEIWHFSGYMLASG